MSQPTDDGADPVADTEIVSSKDAAACMRHCRMPRPEWSGPLGHDAVARDARCILGGGLQGGGQVEELVEELVEGGVETDLASGH